jgi:RES domain-containing protein
MANEPLSKDVHFWRLDSERHAPSWQSGTGAERAGGRWNPKGMPTVYASLDAATAILEVAVHKGFEALDAQPYVLTQVKVLAPSRIHVIKPQHIANPNWLVPGTPSRSQQQFGGALLDEHPFVLVPSAVSRHSWNLLMNPALAEGLFEPVMQETFALDGRLSRP